MIDPMISVIIPAYNAKSTVLPAIQSALKQTRPPTEVIVVDDGSHDGTSEAIRSAFGAAVKVIEQDNQGVAEARNRGIGEATGSYLQFLDADDVLAPEKLQRSLTACVDQRCDVSYSQARFVEADGTSVHHLHFPTLPSGDVLLEWLTGAMANGTFGVASSMFATREAMQNVGPFEKLCTPCEDWDMWIRLAARHKFAALNEPLVTYRLSPGGLSRNMLNMAKGRLAVIRRARRLPEVQARLTSEVLDSLEAGRWHVYAMRLWESGRRAEARDAFAESNRLVPSSARRLFRLMTYVLPASSTAAVNRVLQQRTNKNTDL